MPDEIQDPWLTLNDGAIALHELFVTLLGAGFTESQALSLVKEVMLHPGEQTQQHGDA